MKYFHIVVCSTFSDFGYHLNEAMAEDGAQCKDLEGDLDADETGERNALDNETGNVNDIQVIDLEEADRNTSPCHQQNGDHCRVGAELL